MPDSLADATFVCHYVDQADFELNVQAAAALLETYKSRARLIVTSLLHCALPAIAIGIPVVMFYPHNTEAGHASDKERFSTLASLIRIHNLEEACEVDWNPEPVLISREKLRIIDHFYSAIARWNLPFRNNFPVMDPPSVMQAGMVPPSSSKTMERPREPMEKSSWMRSIWLRIRRQQ